jgi:DNA-binding MarR family transcriptional regulator
MLEIITHYEEFMEQHEIRTLRILEEFEQDPAQSQRDLSQKLKISLGMVNVFTKRLAKKGYFKLTTIPKNRIQYILTPKGIAEKSRLTYQYILYSMQHYKATRSKIKQLFNELSESNRKKVFFFGLSEFAEIAYITLQETDLTLAGIIDDELVGGKFMGFTIEGSQLLEELSLRDTVIITKMENPEKVVKVLTEHGITFREII